MPLAFASPPISLNTAHALALSFVGSYVGSLYISKNARLSFKKVIATNLREGEQRTKEDDERWRNDPDVIRARVIAAGLSTVSSCAIVLGVVWAFAGWDMQELPIVLETTVTRLGFDISISLSQIVLPCLVTPVLYAGPLYAYFLSRRLPFQRYWSWQRCIAPIITTWQGWRDVIVGPTTEEIVFRACTLAVYHLAGASVPMKIFLPPFLFGLAHVHHAWDKFNRFGRTKAAARRAILETVFQLSYTSLFGFHTAFLFARTGSIIPPLTSHIFCNIMGLPQLGLHLQVFPGRRTAIKLAYLLGILGYWYTMRNWTLVDDCLYWSFADRPPVF